MRLTGRVTELEQSAKLQSMFNSLVSGLNVNDDRHREAFWIVQSFLPTRAELLSENTHEAESKWDRELREAVGNKVDLILLDADGALRILLMHRNSHEIPGRVVTVLALFDGNELIDVISHNSYTRTEHHSVLIRDINNDGIADAEISCTPGQWANDGAEKTLQFLTTNTGFEPVADAG